MCATDQKTTVLRREKLLSAGRSGSLPGEVALRREKWLSSREKWLSPVIQATGRQEQWDGLRRTALISSTDGFLGPHYGRLLD
jgi:hypothetical protein